MLYQHEDICHIVNRKMTIFLLIISSIVTGTFSAATCGENITARVPRYNVGEQFGEIYVISSPTASNVTYCKWTFSNPQKFLLNIFFINITVPPAPKVKDCTDNYVIIRKYDAENKTFLALKPYCGERKLPDIRINGSVEIAMHLKRRLANSSGISMAVRIEASSKGCGGIFNGSDNSPSIYVDRSKFVISDSNFVHCTWHFEQDHTSDLNLFVLKRGFYPGSGSCTTYKDFISIFSWNQKTGIANQSMIRCEYRSSFPVQYSLIESKRFTVTVHLEYRGYTSTNITEAKYFFVSKGFMRTVTFSWSVSSGNSTFNIVKNSTAKTNGLLYLRKMTSRYDILVSEVKLLCHYGSIQLWTLENEVLQRNKSLCKSAKGNVLSFPASGKFLWLTFSAEEQHFKGLTILYFPTSECGGISYLHPGQSINITSPNYGNGNDYPSRSYCQWVLIANGTTTLNISILDMDLEDCDVYFYDYIDVYERFMHNMTLRYKLCKKPSTDLATKGVSGIHFHSDSSSNHRGFKLLVAASQDCGGTYRINSGQNIEILSPNYGTGSYPAYSSCQWRLLANESTRLVVSFSHMDLEPCEHAFYDYIQVYKGVNEGLTLKESLCKTPDHYILVDGNMTIRFLSDGTDSRTGFKIRVNATRVEDRISTTAKTTTRKITQTSSSSTCCKTDPWTRTTRSNSTTKTVVIKKFDKQSSSNVAAYTAGIIAGLAFICFAVFAFVYVRRRRLYKRETDSDANKKNNPKIDANNERSIPLTNLSNMAYEKGLPLSGLESENPYYTSNGDAGTDNIYYNSEVDNPEAVYASADQATDHYVLPDYKIMAPNYAYISNKVGGVRDSDTASHYNHLNNTETSTKRHATEEPNGYSHLRNGNVSNVKATDEESSTYSNLQNGNGRKFQNDVYNHLQRDMKSENAALSNFYDVPKREPGH
ncbi:cubilin-like [Rhopilema esculentum]|uniref:cubilin-like n=1 Tax=Rhopilema esculentum TaxID=499914 RepID=UPI0031D4A36A